MENTGLRDVVQSYKCPTVDGIDCRLYRRAVRPLDDDCFALVYTRQYNRHRLVGGELTLMVSETSQAQFDGDDRIRTGRGRDLVFGGGGAGGGPTALYGRLNSQTTIATIATHWMGWMD